MSSKDDVIFLPGFIFALLAIILQWSSGEGTFLSTIQLLYVNPIILILYFIYISLIIYYYHKYLKVGFSYSKQKHVQPKLAAIGIYGLIFCFVYETAFGIHFVLHWPTIRITSEIFILHSSFLLIMAAAAGPIVLRSQHIGSSIVSDLFSLKHDLGLLFGDLFGFCKEKASSWMLKIWMFLSYSGSTLILKSWVIASRIFYVVSHKLEKLGPAMLGFFVGLKSMQSSIYSNAKNRITNLDFGRLLVVASKILSNSFYSFQAKCMKINHTGYLLLLAAWQSIRMAKHLLSDVHGFTSSHLTIFFRANSSARHLVGHLLIKYGHTSHSLGSLLVNLKKSIYTSFAGIFQNCKNDMNAISHFLSRMANHIHCKIISMSSELVRKIKMVAFFAFDIGWGFIARGYLINPFKPKTPKELPPLTYGPYRASLANRYVSITLGIEQELQVVSRKGRLKDAVPTIISRLKKQYPDLVDPTGRFSNIGQDHYQSQLEFRTNPHRTIKNLLDELAEFRRIVWKIASEKNLCLIAAGSNPYSIPRIGEFFAEHVHIGIDNTQYRLSVYNMLRDFLPIFIAISVNSPITKKKFYNVQSYRIKQGSSVIRIPPLIELGTKYESMTDVQRRSLVSSANPRYFDIALFSNYPTIEFRVFDTQLTLLHTSLLLHLVMALSMKALRCIRIPYVDPYILNKNREYVIDYGLRANIDLKGTPLDVTGREAPIAASTALSRMVEYLEDELRELRMGKNEYRLLNHFIKTQETLSDWQIKLFNKDPLRLGEELIKWSSPRYLFKSPLLRSKAK